MPFILEIEGAYLNSPIRTSFTPMKPILPLSLGLSLVLAFSSGISDLRAEGTTSTQRPMTYTLTGVVVDSSGSPLMGAAVRAAGMKTLTDREGRFILHLASRPSPSGVTVRVSYLGMKTREVVYRGQALHITLSEDTQQIGEVVITARPNINALDLRSRSGIVAEVDMKQLQQKPMIDLALALQGSVPGLTVISRGELGEKPEIRIRGAQGRCSDSPLRDQGGQWSPRDLLPPRCDWADEYQPKLQPRGYPQGQADDYDDADRGEARDRAAHEKCEYPRLSLLL